MHNQTCKNNCEFAIRSHMLSYSGKNGDTYVDADYLWKCSKLDKLITMDATVWELGCATFNNECQNARVAEAESLVAEVEKKLDEIAKIMPVMTTDPVIPVVTSDKPGGIVVVQPPVESVAPVTPVTPVERVEPRFVPEQSIVPSAPVKEVSEKPKPDATKKRGRRTAIEASVVNPVVSEIPKV